MLNPLFPDLELLPLFLGLALLVSFLGDVQDLGGFYPFLGRQDEGVFAFFGVEDRRLEFRGFDHSRQRYAGRCTRVMPVSHFLHYNRSPMQHMSQPRLPSNFAARLCLKEAELSEHCSFQLITELVGLYQQAIEYFEAKADPRQGEFQAKLQRMLVRTEVVQQLEAVQSQSARKETRISTSGPLKSSNRPNGSSPKSPVPVPESLLSHHSLSTIDVVAATRHDIQLQLSDLQLRLKQRSAHSKSDWKSRFADNRIPTGETEITDSSFEEIGELLGEEGNTEMEVLEADFETVMERCFLEKQQRLEEVKAKYTAQIEELEAEIHADGGNRLLEQVAARLRQDMEAEMAQTCATANAQRKEQLKTLKAKYWSEH